MRHDGRPPIHTTTKIIIAISKDSRCYTWLDNVANTKPNPHAVTADSETMCKTALPFRERATLYISGSKNLPCQSSLFHTLSTACNCIPYAYPMQLQQLVAEPRQGLLPCILHASLHVLIVHITWSRIGMAKHAFLITLSLLPFLSMPIPSPLLFLCRFTPLSPCSLSLSLTLAGCLSPFSARLLSHVPVFHQRQPINKTPSSKNAVHFPRRRLAATLAP